MKKHQNAASTSTSSITSAVLIPTLSFSSPITTTPNSRASKFKDELLAHKRQTLDMLNKHSQSIKKGKKTLQKVHTYSKSQSFSSPDKFCEINSFCYFATFPSN